MVARPQCRAAILPVAPSLFLALLLIRGALNSETTDLFAQVFCVLGHVLTDLADLP